MKALEQPSPQPSSSQSPEADATPTPTPTPTPERLLTASEVAELFRVSVKTVGRWGRAGAIPLYRTVGGHHRYRARDVAAMLGIESDVIAASA